nr:hypothetical protein CFP56_11794 [Quercus suber]
MALEKMVWHGWTSDISRVPSRIRIDPMRVATWPCTMTEVAALSYVADPTTLVLCEAYRTYHYDWGMDAERNCEEDIAPDECRTGLT